MMAQSFWRKGRGNPSATKEAATVAGRLRFEVLARNSTTKFESRLQFRDFTTNIQNLTFQSPLKLAVKPIVSLVRPTNSLFVSFAPQAAGYAAVTNGSRSYLQNEASRSVSPPRPRRQHLSFRIRHQRRLAIRRHRC